MSPGSGRRLEKLLRQQWNFSLPEATRGNEEYRVELSDVTILEVVIVPEISRGVAGASLRSSRRLTAAPDCDSDRHRII
jgi:hypothetical protein